MQTSTYPELFLERNSFPECFNQHLVEILVASKIETFQFLKVFEVPEDGAQSFDVIDLIIFESHLDHIFPLLEVSHHLLCLLLVDDHAFSDVAKRLYSN